MYLAHHGILGMKWGERNGPPYPLGSSQKNSRERRHISSTSSKKSVGTSRGSGTAKKQHMSHRDKLIAKYKEQGMSQREAEAAADKRISIEKKIAIGAAVTVGALAAYGAYRYLGGKNISLNGNVFGGVNPSLDAKLLKKQVEASDFDKQINDDLRKINREGMLGHLFLSGRDINCTSCSMAYEMRRRGYDVVANKRFNRGRNNYEVEAFFKNAKFTNIYNQKLPIQFPGLNGAPPSDSELAVITQRLAGQGEGARGFIHGQYVCGGGHSIAYEVHNGTVHFVDGQIGRQYKDAAEAIGAMYNIDFLRTDNLTLSDAAITTVMNNTPSSLLTERPNQTAVELAAVTGSVAYYASKQTKNRNNSTRDDRNGGW